jgi:4-alpha-glucanotransferase
MSQGLQENMTVTFRLRFRTRLGQNLFIAGNHEVFGNDDPRKARPLHYLDPETWETAIDLPGESLSPNLHYNYVLRENDGAFTTDWGREKNLRFAESVPKNLLIVDSWNDAGAFENTFYTEPFQEVLLKRPSEKTAPRFSSSTSHLFRIKAPLLGPSQTVCLLGDIPALKEWNTSTPVLLSREPDSPHYSAHVDLTGMFFPVFYKYGVYDIGTKEFVRFEDGSNRVLHANAEPERLVVLNDGFIHLPADTWKGAGVAIPVFSLRSEKSFGVGEFSDLKLLTDWCCKAGLKLIQILPVNDTISTGTWTDSYPYAAISAFALHPMYIDLKAVALKTTKAKVEALENERKKLNALPEVDYEAVMRLKLQCLREIFAAEGKQTLGSKAFKDFCNENASWLNPYAAFSALRDKHASPEFEKWPAHRTFNTDEIQRATEADKPFAGAMNFYRFVQYHLHLQLQVAAEYAHSRGIILKGDIAIGVFRHGADAWRSPELFHMDMQAGAPPDPFAAKGQNWGFPTYNWGRMKAAGFAWWKQRLAQMGHYFDAFRIDHILGFFRIWSIPADAVEGILGCFVPAVPVEAREFYERGINFDHDRFLKPFITDVILRETFGADADHVKSEFLQRQPHGRYNLKLEFATQKQVEAHFAARDRNETNDRLKIGLFDLISNVILFQRDGRSDEFHFRFDIERTTSFRQFSPHEQSVIRELYVSYFFRRQDEFWRREAMEKLPALKQVTNMLICGEDLGLVPACVPDVMKQLGLLSLEIQRMPKRPEQNFSRPSEAPYLSVVTPSTHDLSTIRGWWEEDRALTQRFYREELHQSGEAPEECEPSINALVVAQHMDSPAMWSIFQLQDLLGMDASLRQPDAKAERINIPAIPKHYWRYRMHLTLETLNKESGFADNLRGMIQHSGRNA